MRYMRKSIPVLLFLLLLVPACAFGAADNADWKKLYIDYISENPPTDSDMSSYALIDIDDNDVPELWISFGFGFEGDALCTVAAGKLDVLRFSQGGLSYIKRGNLFAINGGRMDDYYDDVYRIQNGKFEQLHKGSYGAENNANVQYDAAGEPIYQYFWEGKEVSKNEYDSALKSVYDYSKADSPVDNSCAASEIVSKIRVYR